MHFSDMASIGVGTVFPSGAPDFIPGYSMACIALYGALWISVCLSCHCIVCPSSTYIFLLPDISSNTSVISS